MQNVTSTSVCGLSVALLRITLWLHLFQNIPPLSGLYVSTLIKTTASIFFRGAYLVTTLSDCTRPPQPWKHGT